MEPTVVTNIASGDITIKSNHTVRSNMRGPNNTIIADNRIFSDVIFLRRLPNTQTPQK